MGDMVLLLTVTRCSRVDKSAFPREVSSMRQNRKTSWMTSPASSPEDEEWLSELRSGGRQAFALLVERYWPRVYRWLFGLTGQRHLAEDLAQEVFLRAWTGLATLRNGQSLRPWLFRVARNCLIDSRRRARPEPAPVRPDAIASREPGPLAQVMHKEAGTVLQRACARLPLPYRAALLLWTQEGLSYAEIAVALAVSEETARWRVCKARKLLLKWLGPYLHKEMP
jgi:RNA polymerase sigma-70 factor (ECF subfamily)